METLEERVRVWTSFPRHGEFIAEFPGKLFNQRMTEKADALMGVEAGGGVGLVAGDQLGGPVRGPVETSWLSTAHICLHLLPF